MEFFMPEVFAILRVALEFCWPRISFVPGRKKNGRFEFANIGGVMVLLFGAESYIGRIFCTELRRRGWDFILPATRACDDFDSLFNCILKARPDFVINAMGGAGKGANVSEPAC